MTKQTTYTIRESAGTQAPRTVQGGFDSPQAALGWLSGRHREVHFEEDEENPGFWDIYADGRVMTIEPDAK